MKVGDLAPKLAQYRAQPDLTARLEFDPPPPMPKVCPKCGMAHGVFQVAWDEVERMLKRGEQEWMLPTECRDCCPERYEEEDDD